MNGSVNIGVLTPGSTTYNLSFDRVPAQAISVGSVRRRIVQGVGRLVEVLKLLHVTAGRISEALEKLKIPGSVDTIRGDFPEGALRDQDLL